LGVTKWSCSSVDWSSLWLPVTTDSTDSFNLCVDEGMGILTSSDKIATTRAGHQGRTDVHIVGKSLKGMGE
jgi:hypothetical protein